MPAQWYSVKGRRVLTPEALRDCNKFLVSLHFTHRQRRFTLATWSAPEDLDEVLPPRKTENNTDMTPRLASVTFKPSSEG